MKAFIFAAALIAGCAHCPLCGAARKMAVSQRFVHSLVQDFAGGGFATQTEVFK